MKHLLLVMLGLLFATFAFAADAKGTPDEAAQAFMDSYFTYLNGDGKADAKKLIQESPYLTAELKKAYAKHMSQETVDADPILNAQDFPDKGFKVANVPLVLDREPPRQLYEIDQKRVFALTISPDTLQSIRKQRLVNMRAGGNSNYVQMDYILAELDFAEDLFRRNRHWPLINVTGKALEETASIILHLYAERGFAPPGGEVGQL